LKNRATSAFLKIARRGFEILTTFVHDGNAHEHLLMKKLCLPIFSKSEKMAKVGFGSDGTQRSKAITLHYNVCEDFVSFVRGAFERSDQTFERFYATLMRRGRFWV
jgi:hypothetical protein